MEGPGAADGVDASRADVAPPGGSGDGDVATSPTDDDDSRRGTDSLDPTGDDVARSLERAPIGFDELVERQAERNERARPVALHIDAIDVAAAAVIGVGVNPDDRSFEVPPADEVGWYEFGSAPGEDGSAVLAAHIAYNGVDGVFRHLVDVEPGAIVDVEFDDGATRRFEVVEVVEYVKQELPASLFDRTGPPRLALITCGGTFNRQLSSYDSNTVAIAVPLDT